MGIGRTIENDVRIQHLVEVCLSSIFDRIVNEDYDLIEEICEGADIEQSELMWAFEQLGYDKSIYIDEEVGHSFIDDVEKMINFTSMSKEEFLNFYPDVTEEDYNATMEEYNEEI